MSSKYLEQIISDSILRDHTRHQPLTPPTYCKTSFKSGRDQYAYNIPSLLLTPPFSDAEPDVPVRPKIAVPPSHVTPRIISELSSLAKDEQIAILLDRKRMLEAYLQSLGTDDQPAAHTFSPESEPAIAERDIARETRTPTSRIHKLYNLARVRRVRLSIKKINSRRISLPLQIACVNHIQIEPEQTSDDADQETDGEEEEELVFQSFRRLSSRVNSRATSEIPESPLTKLNIKDRQAQLLQSQFAHLLPQDTSHSHNERTQAQSLKSTPRVNHASISRHLRTVRLKTAIEADNNPIRYPRGQVIKHSILTPYAHLDTSDGEAIIDIVPRFVAPPRAEILDRIEAVARSLQESFPMETDLLEPYIQKAEQGLTMVDIDLPGAPHGNVFWDNGVGKLQLDDTIRETIPVGDVHIFMDHSNVFLSWKATIQENPPFELPRNKQCTIMSLPILSLILQRGRAVHPKGMHLAGSSPLMQSFDPAIKLGWECSILKRVPAGGVMYDLKRGAIDDPKQNKQITNYNNRKTTIHSRDFAEQVSASSHLVPSSIAPVIATTSGYDTLSSSETEAEVAAHTAIQSPVQCYKNQSSVARYSKGSPSDMYRMKEQAVDELLHLKILQTILSGRGKRPGTIVLATGDARGGQYNEHGFLGCVREAIARGWNVELWAFQNGMSRSWLDCAKKEGWIKTGRFAVWNLDHWIRELTQVVE